MSAFQTKSDDTGRDPPAQGVSYRDELRLVADILGRTDQRVRPRATLLIALGTVGAAADLCYFIYYWRFFHVAHAAAPAWLLQAGTLGDVALLVISIVWLVPSAEPRLTMADRQLAITFGISATIAYLLMRLNYPQWVMAGPDYMIFTNALLAVPMLSVGIQYKSRPLWIGGATLVGSFLLARLDVEDIALFSTVGIFMGLALPGVYFAVRRQRG